MSWGGTIWPPEYQARADLEAEVSRVLFGADDAALAGIGIDRSQIKWRLSHMPVAELMGIRDRFRTIERDAIAADRKLLVDLFGDAFGDPVL